MPDLVTLTDIENAAAGAGALDIHTLEDLRTCVSKDVDGSIEWLAETTFTKPSLLTALLLADFRDDTGLKSKRSLSPYWRGLKTLPVVLKSSRNDFVVLWREKKLRALAEGGKLCRALLSQVLLRHNRVWYNWRQHWPDATVFIVAPLVLLALGWRAQSINNRNANYVVQSTALPAFHRIADNLELRHVPNAAGAFTSPAEVQGRYALVNVPAGATLFPSQVLSAELSGQMADRRVVSVPVKEGAYVSTMKAPSEALMVLSARKDEVRSWARFEVIVLKLDQGAGGAVATVAVKKDDFDRASALLGSHEVFLAQPAR